MVAQGAAVQNPKVAGKTVKPQYRPHIRRESADTFSVQSERYGYILYSQQVLANGHVTCTCPAGQHGRPCKHAHIIAAYVAYCAKPSHLRPQQEEEAATEPLTFAAMAEEFAALPVPTFDFRSLTPIALDSYRKPASFTPAPASFAECYN